MLTMLESSSGAALASIPNKLCVPVTEQSNTNKMQAYTVVVVLLYVQENGYNSVLRDVGSPGGGHMVVLR